MGKVRPIYIKKISKELVLKYPFIFNTNFEDNKLNVSNYAIIQSKLVRNRIAGYITHLKKFQKESDE
jgi:small subunit ribosomal protein S17e